MMGRVLIGEIFIEKLGRLLNHWDVRRQIPQHYIRNSGILATLQLRTKAMPDEINNLQATILYHVVQSGRDQQAVAAQQEHGRTKCYQRYLSS
jgi:hypothetical protein